MEERVAEISPLCKVGDRYVYDGAGMELGCKILEVVSGETLPDFYRAHLLGPLGCEHTDVYGTYGDAYSIPMDMAKIGQMLLNKGAYGDLRFFSEQAFEKMLPANISNLVAAPTDLEWGIGTVWMTDEGLGKKAFGHGAASSAIFIVDPENDLVIVMTRARDGKNYVEHRQSFIKAIADNIAAGK